MPIRPEFRRLYPDDWAEISHAIRFGRAKGKCEDCGRPHGQLVRCLADGRWYDEDGKVWRDERGREAHWPDIVDYTGARTWKVVLAAAHLDGDPRNCAPTNLRSLCQRCHLTLDRPLHRAQARLTWLLRRALGDLLEGPYRREAVVASFAESRRRRASQRKAATATKALSAKPCARSSVSTAQGR